MKKELEDAHQEMSTVKFEVDRLKNEMSKMKREYFEMREDSEKEVFDGRNFGEQLMNLKPGNDTEKMFEINMKK